MPLSTRAGDHPNGGLGGFAFEDGSGDRHHRHHDHHEATRPPGAATHPLHVGEEVVCQLRLVNRAGVLVDAVGGSLVVEVVAVPAVPSGVPRGECMCAPLPQAALL